MAPKKISDEEALEQYSDPALLAAIIDPASPEEPDTQILFESGLCKNKGAEGCSLSKCACSNFEPVFETALAAEQQMLRVLGVAQETA